MMRHILVGFMILVGFAVLAQGPYSDSPEVPDTAAAKLAKPLLEIINSGDKAAAEAFIKKHFDPSFRDHFPMEAHLQFIEDVHGNGPFTYHSIRRYEEPVENEAVCIMRSERTEAWQALVITANPETGLLAGLDFTQARVPSDLPKEGPLTEAQAVAELEAYVGRMKAKDVFSGTVLLARGEKVLYQGAAGQASKRFHVPNNLQTKFNLGSMNKMFTSVAIAQLVKAGKVSYSDKLSKFIDESWLPKDMTDKIEIRHLQTHSSGLGSYFNETFMKSSKTRFRALDDYKELVKGETLQFEPGTKSRYSNTGMFLLGVVIEKASGETYFDYVRNHIYKPAGMINTDCFEMDQPVPNLAIGYEKTLGNETGWKNNLFLHSLKGGPAGGGFSTVEDLHRFALALTRYKLVGRDLTQQLYSGKPELKSPNYGYGFVIEGSADNRIVGHSGGFTGISSNLDIYLDRAYIAAVMSNYSEGAGAIQTKIRSLLDRVGPQARN